MSKANQDAQAAEAARSDAIKNALDTPFPHEPLDDGVIIFPNEEVMVTKGGIHKPDMARTRPRDGYVLALGSKVTDLAVRQLVSFGRYAGEELEYVHCKQKVLLLRRSDVRMILNPSSGA